MIKKILALAPVVLLLVACNWGNTTSVSNDQQETDKQLQQYQAAQPVPFFDWSMDRQAMIQIYEAKNEQRQTYAVVTSQGTGQVLFTCPALSYPIPGDTQLTNGDQIAVVRPPNSGNWYDGVVQQMEPNGVYPSSATDSTYVLCLRPDGKVSPVYTEQKVTLFPFPVKVVDGVITDAGGDSTIEVDLSKPGNVPSPAPSK